MHGDAFLFFCVGMIIILGCRLRCFNFAYLHISLTTLMTIYICVCVAVLLKDILGLSFLFFFYTHYNIKN